MTTPYFLQRLVLLFCILTAPAAWSAAALPPPPQLAAKSWVLMDAASGAVLVDQLGSERLPPASLSVSNVMAPPDDSSADAGTLNDQAKSLPASMFHNCVPPAVAITREGRSK